MTDVRILTDDLGGSPLSRLLQSGAAPTGWLPAAPRGAAEWRARATARQGEGDWAARLRALAPAFEATGAAKARLDRVISGGGVVVTTGQQPGLFGGPVYTWSKAMSALALADALERETGIPTAAVYWAATDDADFAEASSTVVSRPGGVQVLRATREPEAGTPMSLATLGDLDDAIRGLREACGSAADDRAVAALVDAYGDPEHTVGQAFVALLRRLLEPLGMPVLDASHTAVLAASRATLDLARARAADVERALARRAAEIRAAGWVPQVEDVAGLSLVFVRQHATRRRLTIQEAADAAADAIFTPNVLLRPVMERAILPTVAYVAGPGELAYLAQSSIVAETLGVEAPLGVPRWSCTLVEPQVDRLLAQYDATIADLAAPDLLEQRVARAAMTDASAGALATLRATIETLPDALAPEARPLGLDRAVQGAVHSLRHRIDRLERRLVAGIKRREVQQMRDVATLRGALYPLGGRQERTVNLIPMLARHGLTLLDEMRDAAAAHASSLVGR
jgi:bacillithiol synthase